MRLWEWVLVFVGVVGPGCCYRVCACRWLAEVVWKVLVLAWVVGLVVVAV